MGEYIPAIIYHADRARLYEQIYQTLQKNPLNAKKLREGELLLVFKVVKNHLSYDSLLKGSDPVNKRVMKFITGKIHPHYTAGDGYITVPLFIRHGKARSRSLDTLDVGSLAWVIRDKLRDSVYLAGKTLGTVTKLRKIYQDNRQPAKPARFRCGERCLEEFFEDNFKVPYELREKDFTAVADFIFDIAVDGKAGNTRWADTSGHGSNRLEYARLLKELERCTRKSLPWIPRQVHGKPVVSSKRMSIRIFFEED